MGALGLLRKNAVPQGLREAYRNREEDIRYVLSRLGSSASQDRYRDAVAYYATGNMKYLLRHSPESGRYFPHAKRFMHGEVRIVDVGAYSGDTAKALLVGYGKLAARVEIDAFEPDPDNYARLAKTAAKLASGQVEIRTHRTCAYDRNGQVPFRYGAGPECRVDGGSDGMVSCVRLEDRIRTGLPASFLKVRTGGSELAVLAGANRMIMSDGPYLAVALSDSDTGLLDIPVYLMSSHPGYSWFFKSYSRMRPDFVLYGVPAIW